MAKAKANADPSGEGLNGYFRRIFTEHPKLLRDTSLKPVMDLYFNDHPNDTEDLARVKQAAYYVRGVLRGRKKRRRRARAVPAPAPTPTPAVSDAGTPVASGSPELEALEEQIDECLALAKSVDAAMLKGVIHNLRLARNAVVLKQGQ